MLDDDDAFAIFDGARVSFAGEACRSLPRQPIVAKAQATQTNAPDSRSTFQG